MKFVKCAECAKKHLRAALAIAYMSKAWTSEAFDDVGYTPNATLANVATGLIMVEEAESCDDYAHLRDIGLGMMNLVGPEDTGHELETARTIRTLISMDGFSVARALRAVNPSRRPCGGDFFCGQIRCAVIESPVDLGINIDGELSMGWFVEHFEEIMKKLDEKEGGE